MRYEDERLHYLTYPALQEQIERLNTLPPFGTERNEAIDQCLASIDRLSHEVLDAASFIPAYDQRSYSQVQHTHVPRV
jgi:hypothetical protein